MTYLWTFVKRLPQVLLKLGFMWLWLTVIYIVYGNRYSYIIIIDAWPCVLIEFTVLLFVFFYSKLLEDATSENEKLTEILQVKDETERKQAGA